jgi:hypothetical protein
MAVHNRGYEFKKYNYLIIYISNQLDVTFSKFFRFISVALHVSGVPCPSSGVSLLRW